MDGSIPQGYIQQKWYDQIMDKIALGAINKKTINKAGDKTGKDLF